MANEHYFSASPESELNLRKFHARLVGTTYELTTASGIFSPERIDVGTEVLLANVPTPPPGGNLLDLGDILELCAETLDAAQGCAVLALELVAVAVFVTVPV